MPGAPPLARSLRVGRCFALAHARTFPAPFKGGSSGIGMFRTSRSLYKSLSLPVSWVRGCLKKYAMKIVSITAARESFDTTTGTLFLWSVGEPWALRVGSHVDTKLINPG